MSAPLFYNDTIQHNSCTNYLIRIDNYMSIPMNMAPGAVFRLLRNLCIYIPIYIYTEGIVPFWYL